MADAHEPVLVYDRVAANRRATRRLLALFTLLSLPFIAGLIPLLAPLIHVGVLLPVIGRAAFDRIHSTPEGTALMLTVTATLAVLAVLGAGIAVTWLELAQATRLVLRLTRARPISREDAPELWRAVENLSLAAGLPTPQVYVIEARTPNAFAAGLDPEHSAVVVTRGLLELLDRRGLDGVVAHELSHIGNQDIRLATVLAAALAVLQLPLAVVNRSGLGRHPLAVKTILLVSGLMALLAALSMLGILAEIVLGFWFFSAEIHDFLATVTRSTLLELALIATMIVYGPLCLGSFFYVLFGAQLCGRHVGGAVSRQREFLADADAVLLTRDPEGLALALVMVGAARGAVTSLPRAAAHLFLVEPPLAETGWWDRGVASHPPIEERVAVLGQMGSGFPPGALESALDAGARFRRAAPDEAPPRARARRVGDLHPLARRPADAVADESIPPDLRAGRAEAAPREGDASGPGVVSHLRLAQGPVPLLEHPDAAARMCERLAGGLLLTLLAVEGEFLRVRTPAGTTGYIGKTTPVTWGPG